MNRLALGTAQFGLHYGVANESGRTSIREAEKIVRLAKDGQIDLIDTAMRYGDCESVLGDIGVDGFRVVTKISLESTDLSSAGNLVFEKVQTSMQRMKVNSLYAVLLHQPSQLLSPQGEAVYRDLLLLKDSGIIQKIGISIYSPNELDNILSKYHIDIVQAPFNIFDQRLFFSGWLNKLKKNDVEIHVRSIFLQGLLLMPTNKVPAKFLKWNKELIKWGKWLKDSNLSATQACLSFALSFNQIDRVIVGVESSEQFSQLIGFSKHQHLTHFPDFHQDDENLINPMNWSKL